MADRVPVLVLPGFGVGDGSTVGLRTGLALAGHPTHRWNVGRNNGLGETLSAALRDRFLELVARHDRPIAIVGWSLGGIHAWALANRFPSQVEQVITLGSPLRTMADVSIPAAIPLTSIWSRNDRVVGWRNASIDEGYRRENIEVRSTHATLGFDPAVVAAIVDRLGQSRADWQPFRRPGWMRSAFPRPSDSR
ncbi:MAG: alpha/beta hydrolase [Acidimicrobiales bacterium]